MSGFIPRFCAAKGILTESPDEKSIWHSRYRSILGLERHLHLNGTRIVKFFLHLSKEEQRKRFLARIDEPEKNWKFSMADIEERQYWEQYMKAYEKCLAATSTTDAPWYVVPADDKENARLIVSHVVLHTLRSLKMRYPETSGAASQRTSGYSGSAGKAGIGYCTANSASTSKYRAGRARRWPPTLPVRASRNR